MLWLTLAGMLLARDAPDYGGARVRTDFAEPRVASVVVGAGGSWLLGDAGAGWSGGVSERVGVDIALGDASAFAIDLEHARHHVRDAGAWFPERDVSAAAMEGFRDYFVVDAGFRLGIDVTEGTALPSAERLVVVPYLRLGVAGAVTSTRIDAPAFDGRIPVRSRELQAAPSLGAGVELRVRRWISVVPHAKAQCLIARDVGEIDGHERWGLEWRLQPALDASFNF